jgi:WD40 repeat protein
MKRVLLAISWAIVLSSPLLAEHIQSCRTLAGHSNCVWSVAFSPNGKILASESYDKTIRLWNVTTGANSACFREHTVCDFPCVAFSPDGATLTSSCGGTMRLWDVRAGRNTATIEAVHDELLDGERMKLEAVRSLAFSPDGKMLANGTVFHGIMLWNVATHKRIATLATHGHVTSLAFSPDGRILACGNGNGKVQLWNPATNKNTATLAGHTGDVYSVAFSPDGKTVASGGEDTTVKLWDVATRKNIATLKGHPVSKDTLDIVFCVAFSPDGKTLVSGGQNSNCIITLWDIASRKATTFLKGHTAQVLSLAFDPSGKYLASGGADNTIKLWKMTSKGSKERR